MVKVRVTSESLLSRTTGTANTGEEPPDGLFSSTGLMMSAPRAKGHGRSKWQQTNECWVSPVG
ncbi:MAG: hypothetical protein BJ554DRAFT_5804 [Olpidium bornovanus]|uniref:Uncharacterized protein n=1 Tax=Olpidium bornovanus TaxID=278681 RepID=A0A8H8DKQ3_9FUNG|nr:MAG: hypothetical protein BJ554DRAFT_5804 [Olpidium bornovanus]